MLNECIEMLNIRKDGTYVDGTMGGAGHSFEIAKILNCSQSTISRIEKNALKILTSTSFVV